MFLPGALRDAELKTFIFNSLLLMRRQGLLSVVPWRSQWKLGAVAMLVAALMLHPISDSWLQLGLSCGYGALLLVGLAFWLRPWRG